MPPTKIVGAVDAWAAIALAAIREGATVNVATWYDGALHIDAALGGTTAHLGLKISVQISSQTSGDDAWHMFDERVLLAKTAIKVDLLADEAAGQTILSVDNPVTNNLDRQGKELCLLDSGDVTTSEIVYQTANSGDAGDTITVQDGLTGAHTAVNGDFFTVDTENVSAVEHMNVVIPAWANRVRVLYNNNYGATGSTVYTRCRYSAVTGI